MQKISFCTVFMIFELSVNAAAQILTAENVVITFEQFISVSYPREITTIHDYQQI